MSMTIPEASLMKGAVVAGAVNGQSVPGSDDVVDTMSGAVSWRVRVRQFTTVWAFMVPAVVLAVATLFAASMFFEARIIPSPYFIGMLNETIITEEGADLVIRNEARGTLALLMFDLMVLWLLQDQLDALYRALRRKFVI